MPSRDRVTKPTELVFNISYRCPLKCSHCCFSSDMTQLDVLPQDLLIAAIDDAAVAHDITRINLVGGDPFLQPELMRVAASRAKSFGLSTSATTSAYWATSEAKAERILTPWLKQASTGSSSPSTTCMPNSWMDAISRMPTGRPIRSDWTC
ncbi:radical SAM protein [Bradyrhizobium oligotrophicum S58]